MHGIQTLTAAAKAQVAADLNALMYDRITEHRGTAQVFTARLTDLEAWYIALGGRITRQFVTKAGGVTPEPTGLVLWTLTTDTDHGHGAPVQVHALALDTDQIDADLAHVVA
jgi:hypothetical protein